MKKYFTSTVILLMLALTGNSQSTTNHGLPQGISKAEIYFAEWDGRMSNRSCDILVEGDSITVMQNETTDLTGGKVLTKGILLMHKSGVWIIAKSPEDMDADEIGGCTGGPTPINIETRVIEMC